MAIWLPLLDLNILSGMPSKLQSFFPSVENITDPFTILAALLNKFIIVRDMTDLPDPDSPTTASISPRFKEKVTSCKAGTVFPVPGKSTVKLFIWMSGSKYLFKSGDAGRFVPRLLVV
jgi:hypothetical protein